jgi:NhaP-type Na+/H+ or K+/H+ antiporter
MYQNLAVLGAFMFLYSIVGKGLERTPINGAVVFTLFGLAFGPLGLGLLEVKVTAEGLRTLAEVTLALVLFTDAANADLTVLKSNLKLPNRLLLVGLPLTILLGFGVGVLLFEKLGLLEIAVLATMLAPTDAALGKAVVTNQSVPADIRESLNVESGLNDGICVPILLLFLDLASGTVSESGASMPGLKLVAEEIGIGLAAGVGLTLAAAGLLKRCTDLGWVGDTWRQLTVMALGVSCFAVAQALGGSGFIAAFCGGLMFGWVTKRDKHVLLTAAEGSGNALALITWVLFGAAVIGHAASDLTWQVLLYALLSLTVVRMLPVYLALTGTRLRTDEKLFTGWFGPRGLASIVFGVIVFDRHLPGAGTIVMTVVSTIVLSVLAHGLSANPLVSALAARTRRLQGKQT